MVKYFFVMPEFNGLYLPSERDCPACPNGIMGLTIDKDFPVKFKTKEYKIDYYYYKCRNEACGGQYGMVDTDTLNFSQLPSKRNKNELRDLIKKQEMENEKIEFELELKCSATFDMKEMSETHIIIGDIDRIKGSVRKMLAFCAAVNQAKRLGEMAMNLNTCTTQNEYDADNYKFIIKELVKETKILSKEYVAKYSLNEAQIEDAKVNHTYENLDLIRGAKNLAVIKLKYEEAAQLRDIEKKIMATLEEDQPWNLKK
jgi:hypothetical protein